MRLKLFCFALLFVSAWTFAEEHCALTADEQAILDQTNARRQEAGRAALKPNAVLFAIARKHAEEMAKANKLEHRLNGKNSGDRADAAGYKWTTVSENIAWNQRSVAEVMDGWMRSSGHRANLLGRDVTEMGVGIAANSKGELYWVQVFAQPEVSRPVTESGALKFSIHNVTGGTLNVDVRVGRLFRIKPGETVSYALTTPEAQPSIIIADGGSKLLIKVENGAQYTLATRAGRIEVLRPGAEAP